MLEIGTRTGYNAALLAARLGAPHVTTVEIDPVLAECAQACTAHQDLAVIVATSDGIHGHPDGAPYARVIATAALRVGELSYPWVAQEVIVTPMRTDFGGSLPLVHFTVRDNGTANRQARRPIGFTAVRSQRTPDWTLDHLDPDADISTITVKPWRVANNRNVRWAIGTQVPCCVWEHHYR